jgi:DNA-binding NarL/FixJ family response regulator
MSTNLTGTGGNAAEVSGAGSIGVLIVVGVCLYREGLAALLAQQTGIVVKGVAADQNDAVAYARSLSPQVVLLDTGLPNSLATVTSLLAVAPGCRVIALGVAESETEVITYAEAGVSGYVTRDGSFEDLVAAIRSAARGELLCSPRISALLLRQIAKVAAGVAPDLDRLTPRELQIVGLIDEGYSNKEIANRLNIEVSTVKNHVHHILEKLGAERRIQAAAILRPLSPLFRMRPHSARQI